MDNHTEISNQTHLYSHQFISIPPTIQKKTFMTRTPNTHTRAPSRARRRDAAHAPKPWYQKQKTRITRYNSAAQADTEAKEAKWY